MMQRTQAKAIPDANVPAEIQQAVNALCALGSPVEQDAPIWSQFADGGRPPALSP